MRAVDVERRTDHVHRAEEGEPLYVIPVDVRDERSAVEVAVRRAGPAVAAQPGAGGRMRAARRPLRAHDRGSVARKAHGILVERGSGPSHTVKGQPHRGTKFFCAAASSYLFLPGLPGRAHPSVCRRPAASSHRHGWTACRAVCRLRTLPSIVERRQFLFALAAGTVASLAGCAPLQPMAGAVAAQPAEAATDSCYAAVATEFQQQVPNVPSSGCPDTRTCSP